MNPSDTDFFAQFAYGGTLDSRFNPRRFEV
jgi:hypothetical protein